MFLACALRPEFGYFGSPQLCRKLGLVLAFIVFGLVAGANGLAVLMADHDPDPSAKIMLGLARRSPTGLPLTLITFRRKIRASRKDGA